MARGVALASVPDERERRTAEILAELTRTRDPRRTELLVEDVVRINLPLCDSLAARYRGRGAELDDLRQVARTALLLAVRRFEPGHGRPFASFAVPTITGELKRYFRDHGWTIRPPRPLQELRARAVRGRAVLEQRHGGVVTVDELGRHLGVGAGRLRESLLAGDGYRPRSLDAPLGGDATTGGGAAGSLADTLSDDEDALGALIDRIDLGRVLAALPRRDRLILRWRFAEECTQSEIAGRLGVSQMQVSRMLRALLAQLRVLLQPPEPVVA